MSAVSLEDRLAIEDLVTEYAWLLDHQKWDDVPDLFTDDAEVHIRRREIIGRAGLIDWAAYRAEKVSRQTQHQMTLLRLKQSEPDRIEGTVALVLHVAKAGGGATYVDLVGEYEDEYVRTPDGWKFRRRRLVPISG